MLKNTLSKVGKWVKDEEGFEVFEKFGLTQGGVLLALGVVAIAIYFLSTLWQDVAKDMGEELSNMSPTTAGQYQGGSWVLD